MAGFEKIEQTAKSGTYLYDLKNQLKDYVYGLSDKAFEMGDTDRNAIIDKAGVEKRQEYIRECFIKSIGGIPEPSKSLAPKITGVLQFDGYRIEKIIYTPRDNVYVTANMYIPDNIKEKTAAVIFVCGHLREAKHGGEYQIVCRYLAKAGLIVFAQDPIGQGERFSYMDTDPAVNWGVDEHEYAGFQCGALNKSISRYFVHDTMRAVDYLESRPEVDPERIGITGNSGGGTQTSMMMMAERRFAAAAPTTFIMNRRYYMKTGQAQDREQIWKGLTAYGIDHEDIILSLAPKPVMILGVIHDFFPIEATEKTYNRCKRFWDIYGKQDSIERFYDDCDHHYTRKMAKKSAAFFAKHLLLREIDPDHFFDDDHISAIDEKMLYCTSTGQVMTSIPDAYTVYDENNREFNKLNEKKNNTDQNERKNNAVKFLRGQINKNRAKVESYFMKRWLDGMFIDDFDLHAEGYLWMAQEDIINGGLIFKNKNNVSKKLPVTIAIWSGGTYDLSKHAEFIKQTCENNRAVFVLDVTGTGITSQQPLSNHSMYGFLGSIFKLNDDLLWLDDSLAAVRTFDILRLIDILENNEIIKNNDVFDVNDIEIYTHGRYSVYADIAKFADEKCSIKKVISDEPFISYAGFIKNRFYDRTEIASFIFPGLIEYTDFDEMRKF